MNERDFCIGEEQVEKLFRELLEEPEPVYERPINFGTESRIKAEDLHNAIKENFTKEIIESIFEKDNAFYRNLKK